VSEATTWCQHNGNTPSTPFCSLFRPPNTRTNTIVPYELCGPTDFTAGAAHLSQHGPTLDKSTSTLLPTNHSIPPLSYETPVAANGAAAALNCRSTMVPLQTRHSVIPSLPHQCASSHCCPTCTVWLLPTAAAAAAAAPHLSQHHGSILSSLPHQPRHNTPNKYGCQQQQQQPLTCRSIMVPLRKVLAALSRANMSSGRGSPGERG
jgi:hypothetical protein